MERYVPAHSPHTDTNDRSTLDGESISDPQEISRIVDQLSGSRTLEEHSDRFCAAHTTRSREAVGDTLRQAVTRGLLVPESVWRERLPETNTTEPTGPPVVCVVSHGRPGLVARCAGEYLDATPELRSGASPLLVFDDQGSADAKLGTLCSRFPDARIGRCGPEEREEYLPLLLGAAHRIDPELVRFAVDPHGEGRAAPA